MGHGSNLPGDPGTCVRVSVRGTGDRWVAMPQPSRRFLLVSWAFVCAVTAVLLLAAQRQSVADITRVFEDRAEIAARLTETYARDLLDQERRVATRELSSPRISDRNFGGVTNLFGYEAAVLLDDDGRVLRVTPAAPALLGKNLTKKYAHLREAAAGRTAVSKVVPSAAKGVPIVAFAIPFETKQGRRVFSGAFDVRTTPIGAYLRNATPLKGARVYLYDSDGTVVASNRRDLVGVASLAQADPDLARGRTRSDRTHDVAGQQYVSRAIAGTPWRLMFSVPKAQLFQPINGSRRSLPWLLWSVAALGGFTCALLVGNLLSSRRKLSDANETLDRVAHVDPLTGVCNRRQTQHRLDEALANPGCDEKVVSVLMIDVDHFKQINDAHGHEIGDEALRLVADVVGKTLRADDMLGRWGGEEFLAIVSSSDPGVPVRIAERVREAIVSTPFVVADQLVSLSVSIGVATHGEEPANALVAAADRAMYAAKTDGRDRVRVAS